MSLSARDGSTVDVSGRVSLTQEVQSCIVQILRSRYAVFFDHLVQGWFTLRLRPGTIIWYYSHSEKGEQDG